ncbi:MAG TPA: glycosyl hydrolase family 17 protein [Chthoniobacterales bacterium]|nr:glycosyl hydrolase family 17 protein [Chthoniobacterales bacterium]
MSSIGVNFSNTFQSDPIAPQTAAAQIQSAGITSVKMFNYSQSDFLQAARSKDLKVLVGVPNDELSALANGQTSKLLEAIQQYSGTITTVCVGNEPLGAWWNGQFNSFVVPAITNVYNAIQAASLNIKVTIPFNYSIMGNSYPPSAGSFNPSLLNIIVGVCDVIRKSGSEFMVNIYPYLVRLSNQADVPLDYCLFTAGPDHWVHDGKNTYKNIFSASYDALSVALAKNGFGNLPIVVGECGWPTAGGTDASIANAETFNQNLVRYCESGAGTPRVPNKKIACYLFEMYDEDRKSTDPGAFETHWGVYSAAGSAKYPLSFS